MNESTFILVVALVLIVNLIGTVTLVFSNRASIAQLTKAVTDIRNDTRVTDAIEKSYLSASQIVKTGIDFARDVVLAAGKATNGMPIDSFVDATGALLSDITDGKPNVAPGAFNPQFDPKTLQTLTPAKLGAETTAALSKAVEATVPLPPKS